MPWPTWYHAAILCAVCCAVLVALRVSVSPMQVVVPRWRTGLHDSAMELGLMSALYAIWRLARSLPLDTTEGAIERARNIVRLQHTLHLPTELSLQHFVLDHAWLGWFLNYYYALLHVPALLACMVWLFVRHRGRYAHIRNGLAVLTAGCLVIRYVRVAPPRLVPDLGYIDLASRFGLSVYGPVGTGVSDQLAAMPSIHVGWAAVVSVAIVTASTSRWRWWGLSHVVLTMLAVSATGNHWWLDGIVAIAILAVGLLADSRIRTVMSARRAAAVPSVHVDAADGLQV